MWISAIMAPPCALTAVILVALHTNANITLGPKQQPHERAHRHEALREGGLQAWWCKRGMEDIEEGYR